MRKKISNVLMILGIVLILGAAGLAGYNYWESQQAGARSAEIVGLMEDYVWQPPEETAPDDLETVELPTVPEMPIAQIDGKDYVGKIAIPALDVELPIISEWSYDGLQVAPCRYNGSVYTKDLVVCGHSYAKHFGYLPRLKPGDPVTVTLMDDTVFRYEVAEVEILQPTAVDEMIQSGYPLSLFTCTRDSQARVTVRCVEAK